MDYMTKVQVNRQFREYWKRIVQYCPDLKNDRPARRESWNNYTDSLCKDGCISEKQYSTWDQPSWVK